MAFAIVTSTLAQSTDDIDVTTASIDTTGASLLVIAVADTDNGGGPATVSDSKSNTWTGLTAFNTGTVTTQTRLHYSTNPTVGTGHTFTANSVTGPHYPTIAVIAVSGAALTTPFDVQNGNAVSSNTVISPGNLTPTYNSEIIIVNVGSTAFNAELTSITQGFTILESSFATANAYGLGLAYLIQTLKGVVNPAGTVTGGAGPHQMAVSIASFRASAAIPEPRRVLLGVGR